MIFFFPFFLYKKHFFPAEWEKLFSPSLILLKVATVLACKSWISSDCILIPTKLEFPSMQVYPTLLTQRTQIQTSLTVMEEIKKILTPPKPIHCAKIQIHRQVQILGSPGCWFKSLYKEWYHIFLRF